MTLCCIALGANLGDPAKQFESALSALNEAGHQILHTSQNYVTPPMGSQAGDDFHNAAAVVDTELPPEQFLQTLHKIEATLGRQRALVWGPRSLDLDLLFYKDAAIQSAELVVPHPSLWFRRFVLEPLSDVAADWVHPTLKESVKDLLQRLNVRPLRIEIQGEEQSSICSVGETLGNHFREGSFELTDRQTADQFAAVTSAVSATGSHGVQPNLESTRLLRRPADNPLESFLRDILTAALPHNQLIAQ